MSSARPVEVLIEPAVGGRFFIRDSNFRVWDGSHWCGFGEAEKYPSYRDALIARRGAVAVCDVVEETLTEAEVVRELFHGGVLFALSEIERLAKTRGYEEAVRILRSASAAAKTRAAIAKATGVAT